MRAKKDSQVRCDKTFVQKLLCFFLDCLNNQQRSKLGIGCIELLDCKIDKIFATVFVTLDFVDFATGIVAGYKAGTFETLFVLSNFTNCLFEFAVSMVNGFFIGSYKDCYNVHGTPPNYLLLQSLQWLVLPFA